MENSFSADSKYSMLGKGTSLDPLNRDSGKYVFIKESNETAKLTLKPSVKTDSKDYVMEGIFAFFGRENENGRIYEEAEYMPHLEYLIDKVKKKKLLGELDHPKEFDISLNNVSHIVEDLWLDKENRVLRGRIKVLTDTPKGQILKSLIDNGVPVSISSRAAGLVENNKKVKIKRIFTYDVVADAGFGDEAELGRIYESINYIPLKDDFKKYVNISESLGINNKTIQIYDLGDDEQKLKALLEKTTVKEMNYVSENDFNAYTDLMKKHLQSISDKLALFESKLTSKNSEEDDSELKTEISDLREQISGINAYNQHLFENIKSLKDSTETSKYQELFDKVAKLETDLVFEKKYVDHIFENLTEAKLEIDANGKYFDHLYENMKQAKLDIKGTEKYQQHLYENLNKAKLDISNAEKYQDHLFENMKHAKSEIEFNNKYSAHLYEAAKALLNESTVSTAYMQHLKHNIATINEGRNAPVVAPVAEPAKVEPTLNESVSISFDDKIDNLLKSAKNKKVEELSSQFNFFSVISEKLQQDFLSLDETKKQKVTKALADKKWSNEADVVLIMNEALVDHIDENKKWLVEMPEAYKAKWENLSESKKAEITKQTANYTLQTPYQIKWFWETRALDESVDFQPLNENKSAEFQIPSNNLGYTVDDSLINSIGKSFNK